MISRPDFEKKQIVFVFTNQGEKLSFSNDNLVLEDNSGKIKFQCTCYRLFLVLIIGGISITSGLIQRSRKFGFSIVLMTQNLKPYQTIGNSLEGNVVLRKVQYSYSSLDIAKHISKNKIQNQRRLIMAIRDKNDYQVEAVGFLDELANQTEKAENLRQLMGIEGSASRIFFPNYYNTIVWRRREPRTKADIANTLLDIGYSLLFSFVDALLNCFGFDTYKGVMHTEFYMRKSLTCDIIEPFRCLIEKEIRKAFNLKRVREEDFIIIDDRYTIKWEKNAEYVSWLAAPIIERKSEIHFYIQSYYRAFMKQKPASEFPEFII